MNIPHATEIPSRFKALDLQTELSEAVNRSDATEARADYQAIALNDIVWHVGVGIAPGLVDRAVGTIWSGVGAD